MAKAVASVAARRRVVRLVLGTRRAMRVLAVAFSASLLVAAAAPMLACGRGRLPAPAYVGQPQEALVEVPYPPPPARVEFVPEQPDDGAVWIDGEWVWQGRRYAWKPGRWVRPPSNAAFSPWAAVRDTMGSLYVAEGKWRDESGNEIAAPTPIAVGRSTRGAVTDPEGDVVKETATQPADAQAAPRELIVDAGDFGADAQQLPDGGSLEPSDASLIPEAAGFDAQFDAGPVRMSAP